MKVANLVQGTPDWHAYRANHFNASDAPAMMGVSPYKTRSELLHEIATGITKEIDADTQKRFDDGHRFEDLARSMADEIAGSEFYPVTGSEGRLSASFDGVTLCGNIIFEHKTLNNEIRAAQSAEELGAHLRVQMEQQLFLSNASKCLFLASKWSANGELIEAKHFWYFPDFKLRSRILTGWSQFDSDLAEYKPKELAEKPIAEAIMQLPALAIQIRGEVVASNLPQFKEAAEQFIANIKTELVTDQDFADAKSMVKFCSDAEDKIDHAKASAISQTISIDEMVRTLDHIQAKLRTTRLKLNKSVTDQEAVIKNKILSDAKALYAKHVSELESEIKPIKLVVAQPDFAGAMKNKRTLASLHNAVDTELANAKIEADAIAKAVRFNLNWYNSNVDGHEFLFRDLQSIICKASEDFQLIVATRITQHKKTEAENNAKQAAPTVAVGIEFKTEPVITTARAMNVRPTDAEIIQTLSLAYKQPLEVIIEWMTYFDVLEASVKLSEEL